MTLLEFVTKARARCLTKAVFNINGDNTVEVILSCHHPITEESYSSISSDVEGAVTATFLAHANSIDTHIAEADAKKVLWLDLKTLIQNGG